MFEAKDFPLALVGSDNEDGVPVILERPIPEFVPDPGEVWRPATDDEYQRYVDFYDDLYGDDEDAL